MGATTFRTVGIGPDVGDVFRELVRRAQYEHGHAGYTGTIAEKSGYRQYAVPPTMTAQAFITEIESYDPRPDHPHAALIQRAHEDYDDKWGPAVGVEVPPAEHAAFLLQGTTVAPGKKVFVFFGWASE